MYLTITITIDSLATFQKTKFQMIPRNTITTTGCHVAVAIAILILSQFHINPTRTYSDNSSGAMGWRKTKIAHLQMRRIAVSP